MLQILQFIYWPFIQLAHFNSFIHTTAALVSPAAMSHLHTKIYLDLDEWACWWKPTCFSKLFRDKTQASWYFFSGNQPSLALLCAGCTFVCVCVWPKFSKIQIIIHIFFFLGVFVAYLLKPTLSCVCEWENWVSTKVIRLKEILMNCLHWIHHNII
jgi:hypothetical protein